MAGVVLPGGYQPAATAGECVYDADAAQRAVQFFENYLTHSVGEWAGRPFTLEGWQRDVVTTLFGWFRPDGRRRYRECYLTVARKNGKSTLGAGIGLKLTLADGEPGAKVYSAAADAEQAAIVFETAQAMVQASPPLRERTKLYRRSITAQRTHSAYKVLTAAPKTKHGLHAHGVLFDELHAQPNRELWDVLKTSTAARRQPLVLAMTTAGWDRASICWEVHDYACRVRDGQVRVGDFLPVVYEVPSDADWEDPRNWALANPNLGVSISMDYLEAQFARAKTTPAYENTFRNLHLNQWTGQAARWLPMMQWHKIGAPIYRAALAGRPCVGGLDLSIARDLTALVLLFPPISSGERWQVLCEFWLPRDRAAGSVDRDPAPYTEWARAGYLHLTPGNVVDYGAVRARILELASEFDLVELGYDPYNAEHLCNQQLGGEDGLLVRPIRQGFLTLSPACKELERMVLNGDLNHGNHPVLTWCADNAAVRIDPAGNIKPDKAESRGRIDGIVALAMAVATAQAQPTPWSVGMKELIVI